MVSFLNLFSSDYAKGKRPDLYLWHPKGLSTIDKRILLKLDLTLLVYGCLSFWVKYLDSANLTNAYVTGMKEDLGLLANQLTLMGTLFTAGGIIFQIPSNLLITRIPPRLWLPGCEFMWGLCTLLLYRVTSAKQIYALRFIIGMLEGSMFVGMHFIFGAWYTRHEIGKRAAIFACWAYAGSMFSGFIQSGVQKGLNGTLGHAGWRWLFIMDAILTFFVAIFGVIFFPGTPEKCTAWYLNEEEKVRAIERLRHDGKAHETDIISWGLLKRVLSSWQIYLLLPTWCCWNNTLGKYIGTVFALFMKNNPIRKFSVYDINNVPTSVPGFNIIAILFFAWAIEVSGRRLSLIYVCLIIQIIGTSIVLAFPHSLGGMITGYMLGAMDGPTSPILLTWANILCYGDAQVRALTLAMMNTFAGVTSTLINQFVYKVTTAPRFHKGVTLSLCAVILELVGVTVLRYVELRTAPERDAATAVRIAEAGYIVKDEDSYHSGSLKEKEDGHSTTVAAFEEKQAAGMTPIVGMSAMPSGP